MSASAARNEQVQQFAYHQAVAPLVWLMLGLSSIELIVVHLMVGSLVGRVPALILSAVTVVIVGWLVIGVASMRRLPVQLDAELLIMRAGLLKRVDIPTASIAGVRSDWGGASLKNGGTVNLALIAYPNVLVDLDPPLQRRRRSVHAVGHRLSDPAAFTRAIDRLVAAR